MFRRWQPLVLWSLAILLAGAVPTFGWTPDSQRMIGLQAARLAPPDLYRQLVRNRQSYVIGIEEPFRNGEALDRYVYPNGSGRLDAVIRARIDEAVAAIRAPRPFNEIAYRIGLVAHYVALANNPVFTDGSDPTESRWSRDFLSYLDSVEPRVRVVFYGFHDTGGPVNVDRLLDGTLQRSRGLYPVIGREYRRIGFGSGVRSFDDRSTAFAVASLGYSHAVSDIAEVLRYIWLEAGGIDARRRLPRRGQALIPLRRLDPASDSTSR